MKLRKVKIGAVLMMLVLVAGLVGCNSGGSTSSTQGKTGGQSATTPDSSGGAASEGGSEIDTSKFMSITMLVLGNKPTNGRMEAAIAEENKLIAEKVNAEVKLQYIEWADWQTNYQLAMASGDSSIDLIVTATDWLYAWPSSRKGAFFPLTEEFLSTYAPQTWAAVPQDHWDECKMDGSIWFIPEDQYTQWTNHGIFYRGDWAKEAGLDKVVNFADLEKYFDGVLANHPDCIPWDVSAPNNLAGLMPGYIQSATNETSILGTETGNFSIFYYDNDNPYTVTSPIMESVVMEEFAVTMKNWADRGFWREDVLNYQGETRDLMYAGTSGADQHHTETYVKTTRPNMDVRQPGSDLQFFYWGQENKNLNRDLITHGAMAVSSSSKNPERALMVYDLIRNDKEIYQLHNLGIEDSDYIINSDGTLGRPDGWDQTVDALDTNFWAGRMDAFQPDEEFWYDGKDDVFADLASIAGDYALGKFAFDPTPVSSQMAALADVCATNIPSIAYGKVDDPVKAVADFRAALDSAGYEAVKAEIQSQIDAIK